MKLYIIACEVYIQCCGNTIIAVEEDIDPVSSCLAVCLVPYLLSDFHLLKVGMEIRTGYTNVCTCRCSPIMEPAI